MREDWVSYYPWVLGPNWTHVVHKLTRGAGSQYSHERNS